MERPKCAFEKCNNPALVQMFGRFICGECCVKIINKQQKEAWEKAQDDID